VNAAEFWESARCIGIIALLLGVLWLGNRVMGGGE